MAARSKARTPRKNVVDSKTSRAKQLTELAESIGVPVTELSLASAPKAAPWRDPLGRATYPGAGRTGVGEDYETWLGATVADLADRCRLEYLCATDAKDAARQELFLGATRALTVTACALLERKPTALRSLQMTRETLAQTPRVRVPTRLHVEFQQGGAVSFTTPFWLGGEDPEWPKSRQAEVLLEHLLIPWLRVAVRLNDGTPRGARAAAAQFRRLAALAPSLPLLDRPLNASQWAEVESGLSKLLTRRVMPAGAQLRTAARTLSESELVGACERHQEELRSLGVAVGRLLLRAGGASARAARAAFDFQRKREERSQ